jgi:hypothetical protein
MFAFQLKKLRERQTARSQAAKSGKHYAPAFAGAEAYRKGLTPVDCPHVLGTDDWRAWYVGWLAMMDRRRG